MDKQRLDELLRQVDRQSLTPPRRPDLGHRVWSKARRRSRIRAGTVVMVLIVSMLVVYQVSEVHTRTVARLRAAEEAAATQAMATQLRAEIASLDVVAASHEEIAQSLLQLSGQRGRHARKHLPVPAIDPTAVLLEAKDRTALILLQDADRIASHPGDAQAASEMYRRAARLFPETAAGRVAAGRLKSRNSST